MPDVLEARVVLHLSLHQSSLRRHRRTARLVSAFIAALLIFVVVIAALVGKVCGTFMLVCAAILCGVSLNFMSTSIPLSPTYWKRPIISLMSDDEYSYSFLLCPKITTATSTEHSTDSSCAFLNRPPLRFRKVTERLRSSRTVRELGRSEGWMHVRKEGNMYSA